ncbi:hypothetical protein KL930_003175 [Ogataea haglerorum]|uniref:Peptidase S26 domain-containing protein n=1 Tax=Ogataea haglerorum TaxID=1937702 RepID=A0AAN6D4N4_9ASCO|nr:uncharacterized protein KL911_002573 [Ogataea haglerorum]KAG7696148.1 hypothetical protein KL915_002512 [Ogataea haglerorum]KAG7696520.1 hypothetical protein KL951_002976 [Ogataea haglerorum]KAG7707036.1 hypothetical protein KL914_002920 [Ogataea haglerorum]KAG7708657.1 hypothetical protein KL950_002177 [Ogataea haglerorum]KAG7713828.1 hypothetical protein KL913_004852 [Ogataea haglerorum]
MSAFKQHMPLARYSLRVCLTFLSWVPVVYVVTEHVAYIGKVEGMSMKPTFNPSDSPSTRNHVLLWKWGVTNINNLEVDDVVFLRSPIDPEKIYTKRIKAKQGDLVVPRYPDTRSRVLVPVNHIWVEGDNVHSIDSNTYGPVSTGLVIGKATYLIWPLNRFGPIPRGGRECREAKLRHGYKE